MRRSALTLAAICATVTHQAGTAAADSLIAARVIVSRSVVAASDIAVSSKAFPGALAEIGEAVGREARVTIYPGRPIRAADLGDPALIERNDIVRLKFSQGGLRIETTGRALGRGARGERLRVMNLASRAIVEGRVAAAGEVDVTR